MAKISPVEGFITITFPPREHELSSTACFKYFSTIDDVDILVNCAGINDLASIEEMTDEKLQEMLQVNLISQTKLIQLAAKGMKLKNYGRTW